MDMGNEYTEARKRATMKYLSEKTDDIRVHAPKGTRDRWKAAAQKNGKSLAQFIIETVNARIEAEAKQEAEQVGSLLIGLLETQESRD